MAPRKRATRSKAARRRRIAILTRVMQLLDEISRLGCEVTLADGAFGERDRNRLSVALDHCWHHLEHARPWFPAIKPPQH
jgi:hypothetical protein